MDYKITNGTFFNLLKLFVNINLPENQSIQNRIILIHQQGLHAHNPFIHLFHIQLNTFLIFNLDMSGLYTYFRG